MKISNLKLNATQISGNAEGSGILLSMAPGYDYDNGKRLDTQSHIRYEAVFPDNLCQKLKAVASPRSSLLLSAPGRVK